MRVLVIDDNLSLANALRVMLAEHGHDVDVTDSPSEAVTMVDESLYDFILVDYKMPEHDGTWFMKNASIPNQTKALLITAFVNRDVIEEMFRLGACGYLVKPFEEAELLRHLEFYSKKSVSQQST